MIVFLLAILVNPRDQATTYAATKPLPACTIGLSHNLICSD